MELLKGAPVSAAIREWYRNSRQNLMYLVYLTHFRDRFPSLPLSG